MQISYVNSLQAIIYLGYQLHVTHAVLNAQALSARQFWIDEDALDSQTLSFFYSLWAVAKGKINFCAFYCFYLFLYSHSL